MNSLADPNSDDTDKVYEGVARYCSLLSEPIRVKILHCICHEERSVGAIVAETGASQTNVSRQLNTLYAAGVLSRRKRGNFVYYAVQDHLLTDICRLICINVIASPTASTTLDEQAMDLARDFQGANI